MMGRMMGDSPKEIGIMDYVRQLEGKLLACRASEGRANRKVFLMGLAWGAGFAAVACWYLFRHGV